MATANHVKTVYEEDNDGNVSQVDTFIVEGLTGSETNLAILGTSGIAEKNDVVSDTGGAITRSRRVEREGPTNRTATVTLSASTKPTNSATSDPDGDRDPTTDPPQLSQHPANASVQRYFDHSTPEKAYRNSAGQMLDPVPETDDPRVIVMYEKKVNDLSDGVNQNLSYCGTINQAAFTLSSDHFSLEVGAKKALFLGHEDTPAGFYTDSSGTIRPYWQRRSQFLIREKDWNPWQPADYGTCRLEDDPDNPGKKKPTQIKGSDNLPISDPVPLDGAGQPVDMTDPNAKPAKLLFKPYREKDFSALV